MTTITQVQTAMQTVLTQATEQADATLDYTKRPDVAQFTASTLVQTLVWGWLAHPDATIEQLTQTATRLGVEVSPQAIDQRFTSKTATLLWTVLQAAISQAIAADPVAIPLLQRFTGVHLLDSSTVVLPDALAEVYRGCGGSTTTNTAAALKCGLQIDLLTGVITGLDLVDGRTADQRLAIQHASIPAGTLRLGDLGFFDLRVLAQIAADGGFWLSKLDPQTIIWTEPDTATELLPFLQSLGAITHWEGEVQVGRTQRLPARLLVHRVPQEVADQRRRQIRKAARAKGRTPSALALALADWTLLITNVPPDILTLEEALVLMRVRWQIELIFKLWKNDGLIDEWRSAKPMRILCELYAKLLAMLLQQWALVVGCWRYPDRSLVKAAQAIRDYALELASTRMRTDRVTEVLHNIAATLRCTARMNSRQQAPNTYQWLLAATADDAERIFA